MLAPGTRLGSYEIVSALGAGGMGEVYRARDIRLKRDVALKILPESFATDSERVARFQREAEVLASLNHPHIAAIYGLEGAGGTTALMMELVEGPTLADRIAEGPVPVDEALLIAKQIAEALEAAHERGIVHRDLKPANVKVRPDGTVKVLDFGLAKALEPTGGMSPSVSQSPTITSPAMMTGVGVLLGTAAYMSPEQARGKVVDKRSDIWAFGCVLYEMLTGRQAFDGDDVTETLAFIITKEPDWRALPVTTPPFVRRLLMRCVSKDVRERLRDIADARLEIDEEITARRQGEPRDQPAEMALPRPRQGLLVLVATLSLAAGLALGVLVWRLPSAALPITHALFDVGPADEVGTDSTLGMLPGGSRTALAWSPDGRTLAFVGRKAGVQQVYVRDLASDAARPLDGTEGVRSLAFSTDGEWIAFWAAGQIRKVRVAGGPVARICDAAVVTGISWGPTRIVYAVARQLFEVSPDGGEPQALNEPNLRLASPFLLPGDRAVLYTEYEKTWTSGDERVMVQPLTTQGPPKVLVREAADAKYLVTGHLAFLRQGTLFVAPFDLETLELRGGEVAVLKGVAQAVASWNAGDLTLEGQLAISPQGMLAYVASPTPSLPTSELVTVNRQGQITSLAAPATTYRERIESSPIDTRVSVSVQTTKNVRLFFYDLVRGTLTPAFAESADREAVRPIWSSDGKIAVHILQGGTSQLAIFRPDSPAPPEPVSESARFTPSSWSKDGELLVGSRVGDLWVYAPSRKDSKWTQLTKTAASEGFPAFSGDGRWLAYVSDVSGRDEVYVQPYPGPGSAIPISTSGGRSPAWNPTRSELFYVEPRPGEQDNWQMMSAEMATPSRPGRPMPLFGFSSESLLMATCNPTACFSVAPTGQAFFTLRMLPRQPARVEQIRLVLNWFEELKRLVPTN